MQMSRWKAFNRTAEIKKITIITKFCKANNKTRRRNANGLMECHQRNSNNYKNYKNYKILQGQQQLKNRLRNANGLMEGHQRNSENYENCEITRITKFCKANNKIDGQMKRVKGRP